MKTLMTLLLCVFLVGSVEAQFVFQSNGAQYNRATLIYTEVDFTASTANDTIGYLSLVGTSDFRIWGTADDSTHVLPYYQLKNSTTGALSSFTAMDTIGTDGTGNAITATGPATDEQSGGTLSQSSFIGYDQVRFYFDYLASCTDGAGVTATLKVYLYRVSQGFNN